MPRPIGRPVVASPLTRAPKAPPARFEYSGKLKAGVKEGSDVVALPGGRFLVASDTSDKLAVVGTDGKSTRLELPGLGKGNSQLEGVAYDPVRHHLFVAREESREVLRYEWNADKNRPPKLEQRFELPLGGPKNKGVEGLAFLAGDLSPTGQPQLLLVKEGSPRELVMLGERGGGELLKVKLDDELKSVCKDFSAVTVDPRSGDVFIGSDESSTVAQVRLARKGGELVGTLVSSFPVQDAKGEPLARIEGLAFNPGGDLFVLTENDSALHELSRK